MMTKRLIAALLALSLAVSGIALAADISASNWSQTDASNNSAAPDGAPEGMPPSGVNDTMRAMMGAVKRFWARINGTLTSAGGTTAYTLSPTVAVSSYVRGERFAFVVNATNTGPVTLAISGLAATNVYKPTTTGPGALAAGDWYVGQAVDVMYDGTQFQMLSPTAVAGGYTDPMTTRGDMLRRGASASERFAKGSQYTVLGMGANDPDWSTLSALIDGAIGSVAQGDILYRGASSWARLGAGTSGQFLKTQGAGANPTWAAGSSGGITTIASGSIAAAATDAITSIPATCAAIHLKIEGWSSGTATRHPRIQLSTDNNSTVDSTASNYVGHMIDTTSTVAGITEASIGGDLSDQAAASFWDFDITIMGYQGGAHLSAQFISTNTASYRTGTVHYKGGTTAINAIRLLWNGSGSTDAGTYAAYCVN